MNVTLPTELQRYVDSLATSGGYAGRNQVIEEALRQHQVSRPSFAVVMTPALEQLLDEGLDEPDQARTTDELRQRM